jgi:hypothetical protein
VDRVARQVGVPATELAFCDRPGRMIEFHRGRIRRAVGFRECTVADADRQIAWAGHERHAGRGAERGRGELPARCRGWVVRVSFGGQLTLAGGAG